jgi:FAD/FMN-containing dehydrogenase
VTDLAAFDALLGGGRVVRDEHACALASEDISGAAPVNVVAVVQPPSVQVLAETIALAFRQGTAVHPRGGGMSYSAGYLPQSKASIALDLRNLDQVIYIDETARNVVVEAGCTWATLHTALAERGLRATYFGPLSGIAATIGGTISQNGAFFGSGVAGYAVDSVLGLEIVDGTGTIHRIGAWGAGRSPSLPHFGPDLIGPFLGDCGALGVKTKIVLRLVPTPPPPRFASFAFQDSGSLVRAMQEAQDIPHLAELWAFDLTTHRNLARSGFSVLEAAEIVGGIVTGSRSLIGKARDLVNAATLRRTVLTDLPWSLHAVIEPPLAELADPVEAALHAACSDAGGKAIPDTIPRVTRAKPFRTIKALIGPDGERWLPCHGICPVGQVAAALKAVNTVLDCNRSQIEAQGIRVSLLLAAVGAEIIVEPQLFWNDALSPFQRAHAPTSQSAPHDGAPERPQARAEALRVRKKLTVALSEAGCAHLQIGRHYSYIDEISPGQRAMLQSLKATLDPGGILNPGVLGME